LKNCCGSASKNALNFWRHLINNLDLAQSGFALCLQKTI
jgi:hypothetical protein